MSGALKVVGEGEVDERGVGGRADNRDKGEAINVLEDLPPQLQKQIDQQLNKYIDMKKPGSRMVKRFGDVERAKQIIRDSIIRWNEQA